jgi:hypothetical protein
MGSCERLDALLKDYPRPAALRAGGSGRTPSTVRDHRASVVEQRRRAGRSWWFTPVHDGACSPPRAHRSNEWTRRGSLGRPTEYEV